MQIGSFYLSRLCLKCLHLPQWRKRRERVFIYFFGHNKDVKYEFLVIRPHHDSEALSNKGIHQCCLDTTDDSDGREDENVMRTGLKVDGHWKRWVEEEGPCSFMMSDSWHRQMLHLTTLAQLANWNLTQLFQGEMSEWMSIKLSLPDWTCTELY